MKKANIAVDEVIVAYGATKRGHGENAATEKGRSANKPLQDRESEISGPEDEGQVRGTDERNIEPSRQTAASAKGRRAPGTSLADNVSDEHDGEGNEGVDGRSGGNNERQDSDEGGIEVSETGEGQQMEFGDGAGGEDDSDRDEVPETEPSGKRGAEDGEPNEGTWGTINTPETVLWTYQMFVGFSCLLRFSFDWYHSPEELH